MAKSKAGKGKTPGKSKNVATPAKPDTADTGGRPTIYTPEMGMRIAELLAEGKTLTSLCKIDPTLPVDRTVRRWALDKDHPFCPLYTRAREIGFHAMGDDTVDMADEAVTDAVQVARNRLRVETRKWVLAKMLPKIYGDKLALTDPDGGTLTVRHRV